MHIDYFIVSGIKVYNIEQLYRLLKVYQFPGEGCLAKWRNYWLDMENCEIYSTCLTEVPVKLSSRISNEYAKTGELSALIRLYKAQNKQQSISNREVFYIHKIDGEYNFNDLYKSHEEAINHLSEHVKLDLNDKVIHICKIEIMPEQEISIKVSSKDA